MPEATLTLIRHGETAGQSSIRLYGATDIPPSPLGLAQARATAEHLASRPVERVVTSPLRRAREFAETVRRCHPTPPPLEVFEGFREVNFGAWEGWTVEEVEARDPEGYARWRRDRHNFTYPDGSHRPTFMESVRRQTLEVFEGAGAEGIGHTVAVLHKGVIKVVMQALLRSEEPLSVPVDLASLHELRGGPGRWRVTGSNLTAHLPPPLHIPDVPTS